MRMTTGRPSGEDGAMSTTAGARRVGRRPVTTRDEIEHIALELFSARGFDSTTVDDVAQAAGIGRRTFFRYYASKNDVPWGAFDEMLDRMRARFAALPPGVPVMAGIRETVLDFNDIPVDEQPWHRQRLRLILETPALQAHSALRYAEWRRVVADYAGARLGQEPTALLPRTLGHVCLGAALSAYEQWLAAEDTELRDLLDEVLAELETGFAETRSAS
jgi:TetR/AcrR family transcriptional regulator, regulator of mycofactocin system